MISVGTREPTRCVVQVRDGRMIAAQDEDFQGALYVNRRIVRLVSSRSLELMSSAAMPFYAVIALDFPSTLR